MLGRGRFASLGCRCTTDRGSDLKLQRRSWRWYNSSLAITLAGEFSYCSQATSPGCYTCLGKWSWRAVTAGEGSHWPRKLIFAGVINRIILLTLSREFSNLLLPLRVKNHYFLVWKSEESLLFRVEKWQILTYSKSKINPSLLLVDRGKSFYLPGKENGTLIKA